MTGTKFYLSPNLTPVKITALSFAVAFEGHSNNWATLPGAKMTEDDCLSTEMRVDPI